MHAAHCWVPLLPSISFYLICNVNTLPHSPPLAWCLWWAWAWAGGGCAALLPAQVGARSNRALSGLQPNG